MKEFIAACIVAFLIAFAASKALETQQRTVSESYATGNVRL